MQKMVLALASIAVLFSGTAAARELTASEKKIIEESAKQKLKDPDSAKIYWQPDMGGMLIALKLTPKIPMEVTQGKRFCWQVLNVIAKGKSLKLEYLLTVMI